MQQNSLKTRRLDPQNVAVLFGVSFHHFSVFGFRNTEKVVQALQQSVL